ncbi:MAG: hypothetical protein H6728_06025 [Myxococcales bacterium]|nr:hypothetical protein [Myxococcales bacterium]
MTIYNYPFSLWLYAFSWTLALELPIYTLILWGALGRTPRHLGVLFFINAATHPALWYLFPRFQPPWLWIWVAESWVTLTETALLGLFLTTGAAQERFGELGRMIWKKESHPLSSIPPQTARWSLAFLAALSANTFSTLIGFLILR